MFQSRVSGVGITVPTAEEARKESERVTRLAPALQDYQRKYWAWMSGLSEARSKCPPSDPNIRYIQAPICQPIVDYRKANPEPTPPEGATQFELRLVQSTAPVAAGPGQTPTAPPPAPAAGGSALPLIIGAAYLLLS